MIDHRLATAAQAADPATPLQVLADLAAHRPDLRAAVAANPAAYPGLLEWLGTLDDPAIDSALRARAAAAAIGVGHPDDISSPQTSTGGHPFAGQPSVGGQPSFGVQPSSGGEPSYGVQPSSGSGPSGGEFGSLGSTGRPATEASAPYLPVPRPTPYTQPDGAYYPPTSGLSTTDGAPAPWSPTPPKGSNRGLWILLSVFGVLILAAIGLYLVTLAAVTLPSGSAALGPHREACADGDMQACDTLYLESAFGSEDQRFGDTCGDRTRGGTYCVEEFG